MFDRAFLPEVLFEFVVITDTHYMLDVGDKPLEFESRRKQTARAGHALQLVRTLDADFVMHLGDRAQEYHGTDRHKQAMTDAAEQMARIGVEVHPVAGNQDVGDKPDPTMPAPHVSQEVLDWYHENVGPSWYCFNHEGCHFVVLNSQIMNTDSAEANEQRDWVEADLKANASKRIFLFQHMPPYLVDEDEPSLGHYDNIAQPARGWLLDLMQRYGTELLMTGHTHFAFFDIRGTTRFYVCASPSFTRPAFPHVFTASAPPERGRDDTPKMGFYFLRVFEDRTDVHFLRTNGEVEPLDESISVRRLVTRLPHSMENSPLGITLRHPLSSIAEAPVAWPAIVREKVRNDYPLMALKELGASWVRIPVSDLTDSFQRERLGCLREEGIQIRATAIWSEQTRFDVPPAATDVLADEWEIQATVHEFSSEAFARWLNEFRSRSVTPMCLAGIAPRELVPGKQHPRTRIGFRTSELADLNDQLVSHDLKLDSVLCCIDEVASPCSVIQEVGALPELSHIGVLDFRYELGKPSDLYNCNQAAEALFAVSTIPDSRIFFEPLITLDRTMDYSHGILDGLCNPRPAFQVLRSLNTILYSMRMGLSDGAIKVSTCSGLRVLSISGRPQKLVLLLPPNPNYDTEILEQLTSGQLPPATGDVSFYNLCHATSMHVERSELAKLKEEMDGPVLLVY